MASDIEICNLALSNIRAGSINSLNEPSVEAQTCKLKYDLMRDRCLQDSPWSFAKSIIAPALLDVPIFTWSRVYSYPSNCLTISRIIPEWDDVRDIIINREKTRRKQIPYEVMNYNGDKVFGVNHDNIRIEYVASITDPNLFTNDFIIALSHLLASELAIPIIGGDLGRQFRSDSLQIYQEYLGKALSNNMNEQFLEPIESEFISCRR